jgi:hypothetical protein
MRRFLAGKVSVVEDGRMDGYCEEGEKYRNKRNYVPLVSRSACGNGVGSSIRGSFEEGHSKAGHSCERQAVGRRPVYGEQV